jgi:hypothetical protein
MKQSETPIFDAFLDKHVTCATCVCLDVTLFGPLCRSMDSRDPGDTEPRELGGTTSCCEAHIFASPRLDRICEGLQDRAYRQVWSKELPDELQ